MIRPQIYVSAHEQRYDWSANKIVWKKITEMYMSTAFGKVQTKLNFETI